MFFAQLQHDILLIDTPPARTAVACSNPENWCHESLKPEVNPCHSPYSTFLPSMEPQKEKPAVLLKESMSKASTGGDLSCGEYTQALHAQYVAPTVTMDPSYELLSILCLPRDH